MEQTRRIATVTQLNAYLKQIIERNPHLLNVWVRGEVSNYKLHYSGHAYLTLKDEGGVIKAVMFKGAASKLTFEPKDGMKVLARGRVSVYEQGGQYQLYIEEMEQDGIGDLYARFEEMKKRLGEEGLFDEKYKKPIPKFPKRIGLVTAATGAAVRDMFNVISRRYKLSEIYLYPVLVQGDGAAAQIVKAIEYFNETDMADVLIVGRGGGSIEDLWAFNEEIVAKSIFNSHIPVISAVGHEVDFTIADFVADLRAPTPSAAAELAVPSEDELKAWIKQTEGRLKFALTKGVEDKIKVIDRLSKSPAFTRYDDTILRRSQILDAYVKNLENSFELKLKEKEHAFSVSAVKLDNLSPLKVMARGYSAVMNADGELIRSVYDLKEGENVIMTMADGKVSAEVKEVISR